MVQGGSTGTRLRGVPGMKQQNQGRMSPYVRMSVEGGVLTVHMTARCVGEKEVSIIAAAAHRVLHRQGDSIQALVLDVGSVEMMKSIGLGMCIDLRNRAQAFGIRTSIEGLAGGLEDLFSMLKIDRLFDLESQRAA